MESDTSRRASYYSSIPFTRYLFFTATKYTVKEVNGNLRARLPEVVAIAEGKEDATLVDIRSPDEYSGKIIAPPGIQELAIRAGHVPGAINVPWKTSVNRAIYLTQPAQDVVVCGVRGVSTHFG